jgi:hypothetical protein
MSSTESEHAPRQFLAFTFPPRADFGGWLSTALQRIESGGALRIVEALFVGSDADSGELLAVALSGSSAGVIGQLTGFRRDDAGRAKQTQAALDGPAGPIVRELSAALRPGWSIAGLVVEHAWAGVLDEAVRRIGGTGVADEPIPGGAEESWARLARELETRSRAGRDKHGA